MSTKHEQILAAVKGSLIGISGVADSNIFRSRMAAFNRQAVPAIVVEPLNTSPDNPNIHRLEWLLTLSVAIHVRAENSDVDADVIVGSAYSKVMGSSDVQALVQEIMPGPIDWQLVDADKPLCVVTMQFHVRYQTDLNTI